MTGGPLLPAEAVLSFLPLPSLIPWVRDEAAEIEAEYETERVVVEVAAKPTTAEKARARTSQVAD